MTNSEYWTEIAALAQAAVEALEEDESLDLHDWVHENIDAHEYIIYTAKAEMVMHNTDNEDAFIELCGGELPKDTTWAKLVTVFAFYAMRADLENHTDFPQG